jgi:hypothetical protein
MERVQKPGEIYLAEALLLDGVPAQPPVVTVHVVRLRPSPPPAKRGTWFLSPAVFLLAACATFLVSYLRTASVTASTPSISSFDPRSASLDMRVETQGSGLRLSWNRYSPTVEAAKSGMLEIDDGGQRREIALDRSQIVNGSVIYRPASDDVSFRLNLHGAQGGDVAQVLRVLDASPRRPPLEATIPDKPAVPRTVNEPVATAYRETARDSSKSAAANQLSEQRTAANAPVSPELKTPAPVQIASVTSPPATTSEVPSPTPARDGGTAVSKAAEPQPRQTPAVAEPIKPPAANEQPKLDAAPNSGAAPAQPVEIAAYVPPRPLKWVQPDERLLGVANLASPLDIKVKVKINETGHVTAAHALIDGGKRDKKLMAAVAAVVREWIFEPAKSHGTNVPSEETIVIHLGPEAQ